MATHGGTARRVEAVRRFNRFYTRQIGLLQEGLLESPFSLTEARVLYELAHHERTTASHLAEELDLDPGYLSRILARFQEQALIGKEPCEEDRRRNLLTLTDAGRDAFSRLNAASRTEVEALLSRLDEDEQRTLTDAMATVQRLLGAPPEHRAPFILRPHQPGDLARVVRRHGELYRDEHGWDDSFEALVADIVESFRDDFDAAGERCWIAEREGRNVGSVFVVRHPERDGVGRLRLLLVEPEARGLGIGTRLVRECTRFAREAGYHTLTLWTNDVLVAARRLYEREGYRLVREEPHESFGRSLVGQTWELDLRREDP